MKETVFFKIVAGIISCALFALFYAYQEVEIVKTSFHITDNRREVSFLLDQYRSLVYNLSRLESPEMIEDTLSLNEIVLYMPRTANILRFENVTLAYKDEEAQKHKSFLGKIIDRFSTEAEAKVVR